MSEAIQRRHYDRIHGAYEAHYDDPWRRCYRARFFCASLFGDLPLRGRRVLEAMCGSGQTTEGLVAAGAEVVGLDLSAAAVHRFRDRHPGVRVVCASFLRAPLAPASFDGIVVVGGLHHLHPDVSVALGEVHRLLRPGGFFAFVEPHTGSLLDRARRVWYRHDRWFEANEAAIDVAALQAANADRFRFEPDRHGATSPIFWC